MININAGQFSAVSNTSVHETGSFTNDSDSSKICGGFSQGFDAGALLNDALA